VKVQRPGIRPVVERDLDIVARLARSLEARTRWGRSIGAGELADAFADAVREELDFRIEAANIAGVALAASRGGDGARCWSRGRTSACAPSVSWSCSACRGRR
jgi:ubiquinone biosynthesis protein